MNQNPHSLGAEILKVGGGINNQRENGAGSGKWYEEKHRKEGSRERGWRAGGQGKVLHLKGGSGRRLNTRDTGAEPKRNEEAGPAVSRFSSHKY